MGRLHFGVEQTDEVLEVVVGQIFTIMKLPLCHVITLYIHACFEPILLVEHAPLILLRDIMFRIETLNGFCSST